MFLFQEDIWIKICIMLAILGRWFMWTRFRWGKRCLRRCTSGWQLDDVKRLSSRFVSSRGWRYSSLRWRRLCSLLCSQHRSELWSQLSASVGWRCTCSVVSPAYLWIICNAIYARKAPRHAVLMQNSQLSFYGCLRLVLPTKLNDSLLTFFDPCIRCLHKILHFPHCGAQRPSFVHFGHVQGQAHVGLFHLYSTSLTCHRSRLVDYQQETGCCINQWSAG